MAVSRLPHSLNLLRTNTKRHHNLPLSRSSAAAANTSYTTFPTKQFQRILTKSKPFHKDTVFTDFPSIWKTKFPLPNDWVAYDRVLIEEYAEEKKKVKTEEEEKQEVIAIVVNRLMAVMERMKEREIQKFMSKVSKELSNEDSIILAEEISKEIVNKLLGRPIAYLKNNDEYDLGQKLMDICFLIGVLENSCLANH